MLSWHTDFEFRGARRTVVPHRASCEDMKDTRSLPGDSVPHIAALWWELVARVHVWTVAWAWTWTRTLSALAHGRGLVAAWTVWAKALQGRRYAITAINMANHTASIKVRMPAAIPCPLHVLDVPSYQSSPRYDDRGHDRVAQVELSTLPGLGAAVVETDVWTGVTATVPGGVWAAVLRAGAGAHRFVILGPAGGQ